MAEALPLGEQRGLRIRVEALGVLDEGFELGKASFGGRRILRNLVVAPARRGQLAPGGAHRPTPAELLFPDERVQDLQLVPRAREPALLELAGHADEELGSGGQVLSRRRAAPRVRARPSVGEDPAGEHEARLVLGPQLAERFQSLLVEEPIGDVELGLDVRLLAGRPDRVGIALGAEEKPDRLRQNRLPCPRLPGDRVQALGELEVGFLDEDQVLDSESAEHPGDGTSAVGG